jgi:hypothetical protein
LCGRNALAGIVPGMDAVAIILGIATFAALLAMIAGINRI